MSSPTPSDLSSAPRFHVDAPVRLHATIVLDAATTRHVQALRLRRGDQIVLFNGDGHESVAELIELAKRGAVVQVRSEMAVDRESPLRVILAQGICAAERMDLVIQKATELGVHRIVPVITSRTVMRLSEERQERRETHWQNVAIAACEQSGRNRIPEVSPAVRFDAFIAGIPEADLRIACSPTGDDRLRTLPVASSIVVFIGPEGGIAKDERELLSDRQFRFVRFGPRVLRTETAPLAMLATMQALWGDC
ncbi:MAG: 16S rRNA (uracil(1498)-N(3))-methyltransferase [Betaproteobacteria bacterium]|nr:16S rRNA (uracil(1498)-N(3))-methyltransferase [Betaproteobacteria bacterium]